MKGDINGDVSQKLEYLISLMLAKALPEYIPFEIEGIYDETGAIIMYVDLLMLKLTGSKVPVSVLKRCREKLWLDSCEIDEIPKVVKYVLNTSLLINRFSVSIKYHKQLLPCSICVCEVWLIFRSALLYQTIATEDTAGCC